MEDQKCLQETYAPHSECFGCGPSNKNGLRIRSFAQGESVTAEWSPSPHHEAFPGVLNGGIIGSLLDCHCNWTAAWKLMKNSGSDHPPCTVTAEYTIKLRAPTPTQGKLKLEAKVADCKADRATIEGTLSADGVITATCRGVFVAVKPGHPAYHRW
jgi:acyl-coenzyme A thioesterase PaaI-like protein